MSGYLQRLVRTVAHPAESVHPAMGSVFSARKHETDAALPQLEEAIAPVGPVQPRATTSPESPQSFQAAQSAPTPGGPVRSTLMPEIAPTPMHLTSTEAEQRGQPSSALSKATPESVLRDSEREPLMRAADPPQPETMRAEKSEQALFRRLHPATDLKSIAPVGNNVAKPAAKSPPAGVEVGKANSARSRFPANSQPDEIQIHIGRIEVTAVPPPAPRAVKSHRQDISLDAYLKRHEGRVG